MSILRRFCLLLFVTLPFLSLAQVKITGQVINASNTRPVVAASVFLNNTTIGNETTADGNFTLFNVKPGQYTIIVSILGYETYQQKIIVGDHNLILPPISLFSSAILLKVVRIKPDNRWYRLYKQFKAEFLGSSAYAAQCKILNPDSLDLDYDSNTRELTARSRGYLIIENKALGYTVKYLLQRFIKDYEKNVMVYTGFTIFREMKGTPEQEKNWEKNRLDCYNGSEMHFFRSLAKNKTVVDGFEAYKIIKRFESDSSWRKRHHLSYKYIFPDSLFAREDYVQTTDHPDIFAITRPVLYVIYKNRLDYGRAPIYKDVNMPNWQSSIITINGDYVLFDSNGVLLDPNGASLDGYWALDRVGDQLPVDYEPPPAEKTKSAR